jgi:hypothetical protein
LAIEPLLHSKRIGNTNTNTKKNRKTEKVKERKGKM